MDRAATSLEPVAAVAARRRITLWPTFVAYLALFIISQGPGAVESVLPDSVSFPSEANVLVDVLANLHGFLNALVFGATNSE
eukprot:3183270-Prymnesium_polylepis.1